MKHLILIFSFLLSVTVFGQSIKKNLGDFNELKTFDGLTVELIPSNENKAIISGEYADKVQIVNKNGILKIRLNIEKQHSTRKTEVVLYFKTLTLIDANEGSLVVSDKIIKNPSLEIKAQEGAEIRLLINTKMATVRSVSGASIRLSGIAKTQNVVVNSGGAYKAKQLQTEQTTVLISAGGTAKINASEVVKATVKAGGSVYIYGNPKVLDKKTVLGGNIIEVNE